MPDKTLKIYRAHFQSLNPLYNIFLYLYFPLYSVSTQCYFSSHLASNYQLFLCRLPLFYLKCRLHVLYLMSSSYLQNCQGSCWSVLQLSCQQIWILLSNFKTLNKTFINYLECKSFNFRFFNKNDINIYSLCRNKHGFN